MKRLWIGPILALALAFASAGCANECNSAFDCAQDEVCSSGICAPSQADYLTCTSDEACNDGDPSGPFSCVAGACRLAGTGVGIVDAGLPSDAGPMPDAGTSSTADGGS